MPQQNAPSPHLCPREIELLKLNEQGNTKEQIADKMGIGVSSVSAYFSMLRRKGALPPLPPGHRGRRITEPGPFPSRVKKLGLDPLKDPPAIGYQGLDRDLDVAPTQSEAPKARRRKGRDDVSMSMRTIAGQLDRAIMEHIREGGKLEEFHRWALVLTGEILG